MNQGTNSVSSMSNRYETGHSWVRGLRNGPTYGGLSDRTNDSLAVPPIYREERHRGRSERPVKHAE